MARLFPEEPNPASSFAKPEIWRDWARFAALSEELRLYAEGLDIAAVNGPDEPAPIAPPASSPYGMAGMPGMAGVTMPMEAPFEPFTVEELMTVSHGDEFAEVLSRRNRGWKWA